MTRAKGFHVNRLEWYDGFDETFVVREPVCLDQQSILNRHVAVQWRGRFRFGCLY